MDYPDNKHPLLIKHSIVIVSFIFLMKIAAFSQTTGQVEPLYKFMQANADTTIAIERISNWITIPPEVYMLSKKGDTLNGYTYRDLVLWNSQMPANIKRLMSKVHDRRILNNPVDVNEFFSLCVLDSKIIRKLWHKIQNTKPWTLSDDKIDGEGCGLNEKSKYKIFDAGGFKLHLITKSEVRVLYFYAPGYYEKHCKGRKGRKAILKIASLFSSYVQ